MRDPKSPLNCPGKIKPTNGVAAFAPAFAPAFGLAFAAVTLLGCFGDNDRAALKIVAAQAPASVDAEGARAQVTLELAAEPQERLTVALSSTLGAFAQAEQTVTTDAQGEAVLVAEWTSGAEAGVALATAAVRNADGDRVSADLSIEVTPLTRVGEVAQLPNPDPIAPNYLEGQSIVVPTAGTLRKVGVVAPPQPVPAARVVVGIYADEGGVPAQLMAQADGTLAAGVNELAVNGVALPAGTYWFMLSLDRRVPIYRAAAMRPLKYVLRTFTTTLPATYPSHNEIDEPQRNVYLVLGR